jgi:methylglyoxal synthase
MGFIIDLGSPRPRGPEEVLSTCPPWYHDSISFRGRQTWLRIGLIAHDNKKPQLVDFVVRHQPAFARHELYATGHTGQQIADRTGLSVHCFLSGPLGGDQQMGSRIADGQLDMLFFFRDPLFAHPHEPDVSALLRVSDVRGIPVATNAATAEGLVHLL